MELATMSSQASMSAVACRLAAVLIALCIDRASSQQPRTWDEAYEFADIKLAQLNINERAQLLKGVGWTQYDLAKGYFVGQVPGQPEHGIPWLLAGDSGNGFHPLRQEAVGSTVIWPSMLAATSGWDDGIMQELAAAIAMEFKGKSANVLLGPCVNVHRVARGGRNWEMMSGEDPYLGARMARAYMKGVSGVGVVGVVKHFAFNEQETNRFKTSSNVDERTAWELYYPPFEAAVDEGAGAFMCSYNRVNGTHACSNYNLLVRDLKERMGFRGFVMSDWFATHKTALAEGLDVEMPGSSQFYTPEALADSPELVQASARRVLATIYRYRLEEQSGGCTPPHCTGAMLNYVVTTAHQELARKVAISAITLLKNDGILPLDRSKVEKIAVIGAAATARPTDYKVLKGGGFQVGDVYSGGGSGHQTGSNIETSFDRIFLRAREAGISAINPHTEASQQRLKDLQDVDAFIVMTSAAAMENFDRGDLLLDSEAVPLINQASGTGKPVIVCLMLPGAVVMPWRFQVSAVASSFFAGEATGHAWASVLFGDHAPEGRLPIEMPEKEADEIAPGWNAEVYAEGLFTSYRNSKAKPAFPFGHGLSYTTFQLEVPGAWANQQLWTSWAQTAPSHFPPSAPGKLLADQSEAVVTVRVEVVNTGSLPGQEVVQAYLNFPRAPPDTPKLRLAGFQKTRLLGSGQREQVTLHFSARDISTYSVVDGWHIQDEVIICIGVSSADIRSRLLVSAKGSKATFLDLDGSRPVLQSFDRDTSPQQATSDSHAAAVFLGLLLLVAIAGAVFFARGKGGRQFHWREIELIGIIKNEDKCSGGGDERMLEDLET